MVLFLFLLKEREIRMLACIKVWISLSVIDTSSFIYTSLTTLTASMANYTLYESSCRCVTYKFYNSYNNNRITEANAPLLQMMYLTNKLVQKCRMSKAYCDETRLRSFK